MNAKPRARNVGSRGEDGGKSVASVGCISTSSPPRKEAMRRLTVAFVVMTMALGFGIPRLLAQQSPELARLQDEAVQRVREYLQINTTNPPGNENRTMQFFARIFAQAGIAADPASSASGRGRGRVERNALLREDPREELH